MQTILITGVTAGFGAATAKVFSELGWKVIGTGRRQERLDELQKDLKNFVPLCFDVRDKEEVFAKLSDLDVDVLVNNAGLALGLEPAYQTHIEDWETMIDTNIKGLTYVTRAVLPKMAEKKQGYVINIGSVAGTYPYIGGNVYGATKAFVRQFSLNLRSDLAGTQVRATNIEPGLAISEFSEVRFKGEKERADNMYKNKNPLLPTDIAECIRWLTTLPVHVNINTMEVMPTSQSFAPLSVHISE